MALIISFYIGFLFTKNEGLLLASNVQLPFLFLLPIIPMLNKYGYFTLSRWAFFMITMTTVIITITQAHGTFLNVHHFFLLLSALPIAFFKLKQWPSVLFLFLSNLTLFAYFEIYQWPHHNTIANLSENLLYFLRFSITAACFFAVILQLVICEYYAYQNEQDLQKFADIDLLTGISNRRVFIDQLDKKLQQKKNMSLLLMDLDYFKRINDTAGHDAGDKALIQTTKTLQSHIAKNEVLARIGGEEFAMILDKNNIEARANTIRKSITKKPLVYGNHIFDITMSIGICPLDPNRKPQDILKSADKALYEAKGKGRNCVVLI